MASEALTSSSLSIHNETPHRIVLFGDGGQSISLAPLERSKPFPRDQMQAFDLQRLQRENVLSVEPVRMRDPTAVFVLAAMAGYFYFIVGGSNRGSVVKAQDPSQPASLPVFWLHHFWAIGLLLVLLVVVGGLLLVYRSKDELLRGLAQLGSLVATLALGIGMPGFAIYYFGGAALPAANEPGLPLIVLGRCLQLLLIAIASLLPPLLYFLFDRQWLQTLRDRFYHAIFHLDPTLSNLTEVRARYPQVPEVYGPEGASRVRQLAGTRVPIFFATLVISLGWLITLSPFGPVEPEIKTAADLHRLFTPQPTMLVMGFLGSYFFALSDLLRRYMRRDLRPKAYSAISARILVVAVLSWVLALIPGESFFLPMMFLVGLVPETGITFLREYFRAKFAPRLLEGLDEQDSLTTLDGIDLYDRSRLLDEGVTNVEALAHHDLIDLMIETRIPVPRLVDWVDQSVLHLHLPHGPSNDDKLRGRLVQFGIRTATDLEGTCGRAGSDATQKQEEFLRAIAGDEENRQRLRVMLHALEDDEWLGLIREWRKTPRVDTREYDCQPAPPVIQEEKKTGAAAGAGK